MVSPIICRPRQTCKATSDLTQTGFSLSLRATSREPTLSLRATLTRTCVNLSLRGAQRRGNLDEIEHTSANRLCYGDGIATLRSQWHSGYARDFRPIPWVLDCQRSGRGIAGRTAEIPLATDDLDSSSAPKCRENEGTTQCRPGTIERSGTKPPVHPEPIEGSP